MYSKLNKNMNEQIKIGNHIVSRDAPVFCIGELSCNHLHNYELAMKTIDAMINAGVDCVKLQTVKPDKITLDCSTEDFIIRGGTLWDNRTLYSLYKETQTPWEWHKPIKDYVESRGVEFLSSPFDKSAVDFLEELNVPAYKIASFEITDIPLIDYVASKQKPVIISTGIAHEEDIRLAVQTCRKAGNNQVILLKCTSEYPTSWEDVNLNMLPQISMDFDCMVGVSDHTLGDIVPCMSVALGARVVEKHFILDRSLGGPDSAFSMEPHEFKSMIDRLRISEKILGKASYILSEKNEGSRRFMRSLYVGCDMKRGDVITEDNVVSVRPGFGLHPKYLKQIIGKRVNADLQKGTRFSLDFIIE